MVQTVIIILAVAALAPVFASPTPPLGQPQDFELHEPFHPTLNPHGPLEHEE
jgi:hypothetical protein